jgi:hypothetical protein
MTLLVAATLVLVGFYFLVLKDKRGIFMFAKGLLFGTVAYGMYNLNKKKANLSGTMLIADTALGATIVGVLGHLMLLFTLVLNGCSSSGSGSDCGSDCLLDLSFCKICSMLRLSTRLDARNNL